MSPKELAKLAAACRKAGIRHYKTAEFEFTLTDEVPVSAYKKKQSATSTTPPDDKFESDELGQEALMFWSSAMEEKSDS